MSQLPRSLILTIANSSFCKKKYRLTVIVIELNFS